MRSQGWLIALVVVPVAAFPSVFARRTKAIVEGVNKVDAWRDPAAKDSRIITPALAAASPLPSPLTRAVTVQSPTSGMWMKRNESVGVLLPLVMRAPAPFTANWLLLKVVLGLPAALPTFAWSHDAGRVVPAGVAEASFETGPAPNSEVATTT